MTGEFTINVYFDEKGEKIEILISHILVNILEKKIKKFYHSNI